MQAVTQVLTTDELDKLSRTLGELASMTRRHDAWCECDLCEASLVTFRAVQSGADGIEYQPKPEAASAPDPDCCRHCGDSSCDLFWDLCLTCYGAGWRVDGTGRLYGPLDHAPELDRGDVQDVKPTVIQGSFSE